MISYSSKNIAPTTPITLLGRIPSKKNGKIMICRGTRPILISTPAYSAWHEEQLWALKKYKFTIESCKVQLTFYSPDKRPTDLSNKAESVMDLLVDAGLLRDDNWFIVRELTLTFGGVDRENPRCTISFY